MGNVTAIPEGKGTPEEKNELKAFQNGEGNDYLPGIMDVPEPYDQYAGSKYDKAVKPELPKTPLLATDEGQPSDVSANVVSRDRNRAVDSDRVSVVPSKSTGRKANSGE